MCTIVKEELAYILSLKEQSSTVNRIFTFVANAIITTPETFERLSYIDYNYIKNTTKSIPGKIDVYKLMYKI